MALLLELPGNHKFLTKTEGYVEVKDLKPGASLAILTRYKATMEEVLTHSNSKSQDYWWTTYGQRGNNAEHRLIAAFSYNSSIPTGYVVHHKNRNGLDNSPDNLEVLTKAAHDHLHSFDMMGEKNPVFKIKKDPIKWAQMLERLKFDANGDRNGQYSGYTNEDLKKHAIILTKKIQRRFSIEEWQEYAKPLGLPLSFSKWRKSHLGGILGLSKWASLEIGIDIEYIQLDPRAFKRYQRLLSDGYNCIIENSRVVLVKNCEMCDKEFKTFRTESGVCSRKCVSRRIHKDRIPPETFKEKREILKEAQINIFLQLKQELSRLPLKQEWAVACKNANLSPEISRLSSPFRYWGDLTDAASNYNHKVVSVEPDGFEDVYNGTVDEFHNFFVGGFESTTRSGKTKQQFINNLQCGEINLRADKGEFCNLSEVVVRSTDTFLDLSEKVKSAVWLGAMQACLTKFPFIRESFAEICEKERLLGVSLTGQMDNYRLLTEERLSDLREIAIKECKKACKALNINMSAAITTGKPSGTVSQLVNCASGAHPRFAHYYIRRYRISATDPLFKMMKAQGVEFSPENGQDESSIKLKREELIKAGRTANEAKILVPDWSEDQVLTWVASFPEKAPNKSVTRNDVSAIDQLEWYLKIKKNWAEHNQSITIYVKDNEWLKVGSWVYDNFDEISGISFLPFDGGNYSQPPYEEITAEEYKELLSKFPKIDYSQLSQFEIDDNTTGAQNYACVSGACELP